MDLDEIRRHLHRAPWDEFPDVQIYADIAPVKNHPHYGTAKAGDAIAAEALLDDILTLGSLDQNSLALPRASACLLAVHAAENAGMNAIPRAFARSLSSILELPVASGIIQMNRVFHTGADGFHRLAFPPVFEGKVDPIEYVLVDDFIGQGGTLANLRGYVEDKGGHTIGAIALCGKSYSAKLRPAQETIDNLRQKHGRDLEEWWVTTFGYGFEGLTESEARYISRFGDADTIRTRLAAARGTGD